MNNYQEHSDDQTKETNGASKDFHDEYLDEERRVSSVREGRSRSNLNRFIFFYFKYWII